MGGVQSLSARKCAVPRHGTGARLAFAPHFEKYRMFLLHCSKGFVDDEHEPDYFFIDAGMTESFGVELGPLPLPVWGAWGRDQLEACDVV
jgi:hypothetical protein